MSAMEPADLAAQLGLDVAKAEVGARRARMSSMSR
jgi:hypothetical protein